MTADGYPAGSIKQNPDTLEVATRTGYVQNPATFWLIATQLNGGHYATDDTVAAAPWVDVPLPTPPGS